MSGGHYRTTRLRSAPLLLEIVYLGAPYQQGMCYLDNYSEFKVWLLPKGQDLLDGFLPCWPMTINSFMQGEPGELGEPGLPGEVGMRVSVLLPATSLIYLLDRSYKINCFRFRGHAQMDSLILKLFTCVCIYSLTFFQKWSHLTFLHLSFYLTV